MATKFQKVLRYTAAIAGSVFILLTVLSLAYNTGFWKLQMLNFPRVFFAISLAFCLLVFVADKPRFSKWSTKPFLAGSMIAIAINLYILAPYLPVAGKKELAGFNKDSPATGTEVSILVSNVKQENQSTSKLRERVQQADPTILLVLETGDWWATQLESLERNYPYNMRFIQDNTYGMMLFSKLPLSDTETLFLSHPEVPAFRATVTLPAGKTFRFYGAHPVPPAPSDHPNNTGPQEKEVALEKLAPLIAAETLPVIAAGDFNDVGWSHNMTRFQKVSGLADARRGRGLYSTFNTQSMLFRWPLDYVFATQNWQVGEIERLEGIDSDHFPYFVKLRLGE